MNTNKVRGIARDTLYNAIIGASARVQQRRGKKNKRRLVRRDMSKAPRRQGGLFRGPVPKPTTTTTAVMPNAINKLSKLNITRTMKQIASEALSNVQPVQVTGSTDMDGQFHVLINQSINPADPGVFPSLAATANQYQRFRTNGLRATFTPFSSTATDGQIFMAFQPDPTALPPTSQADFMGLIAAVSSTVYGQPLVLDIPPHLFQQAYNSQVIQVPQSKDTDTTLTSSGSLFVAVSGITSFKVLGQVVLSYSYDLMNKQVTQGSNEITGVYTADGDSVYTTLHMLTLDGHETLNEINGSGIYSTRMKGASHLVVIDVVGALGSLTPQIEISDACHSGATWTGIAFESHVRNAVAKTSLTYFVVPAARYWRLTHDGGGGSALTARLRITSLPSRVPQNLVTL